VKKKFPETNVGRRRTFVLRIEKMLAHILKDLHLLVSVTAAKLIVKRELRHQNREEADAYEEKKRKLHERLREKISEKKIKP
jgi:hypothetical protein